MITHLPTEQIDRYLERSLSRTELAQVNVHLFNCEICYQQFLDRFEKRRLPIEIDLDELAGLEGWHIQGEDLKAYVERRMEQLDLDFANIHLRECGWCREEVDNYSEFSKDLDYYLSKRHAPLKQPAIRNPILWSRVQVVGAAAMVLLILGSVMIFLLLFRTEPGEQAAHLAEDPRINIPSPGSLSPGTSLEDQSSPPAAGTRPNGAPSPRHKTEGSTPHHSVLPSTWRRGEVSGAEQRAEAALLARDLVMPPVIETFDRLPAALRGDSKHSESFNIISPYSTLISEDRPTFRWTALGGATSYIVSVYDSDLHLVSTSEPLSGTEWPMPGHLQRGALYTWLVTALKDGKPVVAPAAPGRAEFKVIEKSELVKLNRKIEAFNSPAARAVLYAEAGLLDQAEQKLSNHLLNHPGDERAQELLRVIKSWRQP
jgi:hypothetical protein